MRYGDIMLPLCVASLQLSDDMRLDPEISKYIEVLDRTTRAEKVSDPDTWTREQRDAYGRGDWQAFSRLRGYTNGEIVDFQIYLDLTYSLIAKYGEDEVSWIGYTLQEQTGILGLTSQQILQDTEER
jgi:hypothetical protein